MQICRAILDATIFFFNGFSDIQQTKEKEICSKITARTVIKGETFSEIFVSLDNEIYEIQNFVKLYPYTKNFNEFKERIHFTSTPDFILNFFYIIRNEIEILNDKVLYILIDEYEDLDMYQQKFINRLIKQRKLIFRIASKIKGIKTLEKIDEIHDYEIIPLHFDVTQENREPYKLLAKNIFINRLNLSDNNYVEKEPEILLPSATLEDENLTEEEIKQELVKIHDSLKIKKEISNPEEYWQNFRGHYRNAAIFRLLKQKGKDKLYAGFDEYVALSSGIIRLFLWLSREAFSSAHQKGIEIEKGQPMDVRTQSKAAYEVSKRELYITIPQNVSNQYGQKMGRFIFDIGSILRAKLHYSTSPQSNRIEIIDSEKFEIEKYKILKEIIESGLDLPVFLSDVSFKPRDIKYPMPESFSLNWIFAPFLGISPEKRWRTELTVDELNNLCSSERRQETLEKIIKQIEGKKRKVRNKDKQNEIQQDLSPFVNSLNPTNCPITDHGCTQNLIDYSSSDELSKAFLAVPFDKDTWIYDPRIYIKEILTESLNIRCIDVDDVNVKGGLFLCKICSCVRQMPIGIFEITELNSNVIFELGMATGLNRLNFLLVYKEQIPQDYKSNFPPPPLEGIEYVKYKIGRSSINKTFEKEILPTIEKAKELGQISCKMLRSNCPHLDLKLSEDRIYLGLPFNKNDTFFEDCDKLIKKIIPDKKYKIQTYSPAKTLSDLCQMCQEIRKSSFCIIDTTYNDIPMLFGLGLAFGRDRKFIQLHNISLSPERPISDLRPWAIEYRNLNELEKLLSPELLKRLGD